MREDRAMRTPLANVRGLGSAKAGTKSFWYQRLTGALLVPLAFAFVFVVLRVAHQDYEHARAVLANPFIAILMLLFILSGVYHMWIGMQVILEDYVHGEATKLVVIALNTLFAVVVGLACVYAILRLGFR